jgi:hypothetical protein
MQINCRIKLLIKAPLARAVARQSQRLIKDARGNTQRKTTQTEVCATKTMSQCSSFFFLHFWDLQKAHFPT